MNISDPISDMLVRLRNASTCNHSTVILPHSRIKSDIARVLKSEGYIADCKVQKAGKNVNLEVTLKGGSKGKALNGLRRISTPGRRRYVGARDVPRVLGGMGTCILSTSTGVLSGQEAKKKNVGGEILCYVW